jgi:hypothetical protein
MAKATPKISKRAEKQLVERVFILLGTVAAVVLVIIGSLAWWAHSFSTNMVRDQLVSQKVYFPAQGSKGFSPEDYPDLQKYAGQQVDDGIKARAYAEGYIGKHLEKVAGGKTYSEVSALSMANPSDSKLQQQKATLFQGETLKALLLGDAYAFWMIGQIARYAALAAFAGGALMAVLVLVGMRDIRSRR